MNSRKYLKEHKAEIASYQRAYYVAHKKEKAEYDRKYRIVHKEKQAAYMKEWCARHRNELAAKDQAMKAKHPERITAYNTVKREAYHGHVKRPGMCSSCGADGVKLDGHHSDYDNPLKLTWLCRGCHKKTHLQENGATA